MIDLNDILRQNENDNIKEAARSIYILFRSLCEAGFTEDQAMQIVTATIGNIRNGVQKRQTNLHPSAADAEGKQRWHFVSNHISVKIVLEIRKSNIVCI